MDPQFQVGGIDVYVEGDGPETIVMMHGWPDTYRLWDAQVEEFKSRYRCVRFTLPGFDISKPRQAYSLDLSMRMFDNILKKISPNGKVILMAHDWGAVFGYELYMRFPKKISRIVGVDIGDVDSAAFRRSLSWRARMRIAFYQGWLAIAWQIGGGTGENMTRFMVRQLKAPSDPAFISSGMNYPYYITWTGAYGSYGHTHPFVPRCPMLFIYGSQKPFMFHSPQWAQSLVASRPSKVLKFQTDHWPMVREPDVFNQEVLTWLAATGPKAAVETASDADAGAGAAAA